MKAGKEDTRELP